MKAKILYFKGINFKHPYTSLVYANAITEIVKIWTQTKFQKRKLYEVMTTSEEDIDADVIQSTVMVTHRKFSLETLVLST